jgi:hypothetical protein
VVAYILIITSDHCVRTVGPELCVVLPVKAVYHKVM